MLVTFVVGREINERNQTTETSPPEPKSPPAQTAPAIPGAPANPPLETNFPANTIPNPFDNDLSIPNDPWRQRVNGRAREGLPGTASFPGIDNSNPIGKQIKPNGRF